MAAAVITTRPDVSISGSADRSMPADTLEESMVAFVSPPSEVTSTAAPAESVERSDVKAVIAIEPATVRIIASSVAVTSTDPATAVTVESSAMVAV